MTSTSITKPSAGTWALLGLLGLIWGGSFFFARVAVMEVPPFTLVFLRLGLAAVALHLYLHGRYDLYAVLRTHWRPFLVMGVLNNALPHTLIFVGQTEIGAGLASILNATTPIWTVIIANRLTTDEKLTTMKLAGCLTGLAGTVILLGPTMASAASAPLSSLEPSSPALSRPCRSSSRVSTPKPTGLPVRMLTWVRPLVAASDT